MNNQLALGIQLLDTANFDNFGSGENKELIALLQQVKEPFIYLFGASGVGKSHLLQASCFAAQQRQKTAFYLALNEAETFDNKMLQNLENYDVVCIDDIHSIRGKLEWEEALFHLFNRVFKDKILIVSANVAPQYVDFQLTDLKTRCGWGITYPVIELSDQEKAKILQLRAEHRGLELSDEVVQYVLKYSSRNMRDLLQFLEKLDYLSLAQQRKITIPFVASILKHY